MTAIGKFRTILSIAIALVPCIQAFTAERPQLPTLLDYPPAVVTHVIKQFDAERDALKEKGIPRDDDGYVAWEDCGPAINNAHKVYLQAFKAATLSEKRKLLLDATAMPCFEFPTKGKGSRDALNMDYLGDLRNGTRVLANEAVLCAAQGDAERAVTILAAGYGLLAHHTRAPTLLLYLTRIACQGLFDEALRATLATQTLSDGQLKRLDEAVAVATRPDSLARVWIYEESLTPGEDPMAYEGINLIYFTDAEYQAQLTMARTAIAVERYVLEFDVLPDSLETLVPTYLPTMPVDPLIGAPMGYQKNDLSYAIFSVGKNAIAPENPFLESEEVSNSDRRLLVLPVTKKSVPLAEMPWSTLSLTDSRNSRKEKRAIKTVFGAIDLSQACGDATIATVFAGPLGDGIAVLVDACEGEGQTMPVQAAYWVHDKQVYAVNEWARALANVLPASPPHIDFDAVRDVVL